MSGGIVEDISSGRLHVVGCHRFNFHLDDHALFAFLLIVHLLTRKPSKISQLIWVLIPFPLCPLLCETILYLHVHMASLVVCLQLFPSGRVKRITGL